MATKTLVIDGTDREHFFLTVDGGTLRIGDTVAHTEGVVRDVRVVRIHCEVELEDDREHMQIDEPGVLAPSTLSPGSAVKLAHAQLSLLSNGAASPPVAAAAATVPIPTTPASDGFQLDLSLANPEPEGSQQTDTPTVVPRRFKVIDGGDQGRTFKLPDEGTITLGKPGHANIGLHDLYVSKVHCLVHIDGYRVLVSHFEGQTGTLIDGMRISTQQKLRTGSVLRIGNSHLKLEIGPFTDEPPPKAVEMEEEPAKQDGSGSKRVVAQSAKSTDPLLDLEGQTLGHFTLEKLLGRGFAGAVFHATNTKNGQEVALKVLAPEFPSSTAELERFAHELKSVQGIRHANLPVMLGAGKSGSYCWVAREFVEGESAAEFIARIAAGEKPSWTRAARVTVHLARALHSLKEHKLFHGNITPRNVLLRPEDHATKLVDFRLAQALEGSQLQESIREKKTNAELPYFAPEQAAPDGFVDVLSDLYGIGAVAYALITGRPPVSGGTSSDELRARVQHGKIQRPSTIYKKVPAEFDAIVMKLLARKQEDRYQTASSLLKALEPIAEEHDLKL